MKSFLQFKEESENAIQSEFKDAATQSVEKSEAIKKEKN